MIGLQCKSVGVNRNILNCLSPDSRNIRQNNSRLGTPRVNEGIFSPSHNLKTISSLRNCMGGIELLDTSFHGSTTQERNSSLSWIEKDSVKSVLSETVPDLEPSIQVNLENSVLSKSPKFKSLRLLTAETTDIRNLDFVSSTRPKSLSGTRKYNVSPSKLGYTIRYSRLTFLVWCIDR